MNRGYGARLGSLIHRAISSAFIMLARIGSALRGALGPNLAFARVRGGRNTHHAHAAALCDVDARGRRVSHTLTAADCDGVGAASKHRERYRQYGAKGSQGEDRGS